MRQPVYHSAAVENSCLFHTLKLESAPILEYYNPRWARLFADLGCTAFAADPPEKSLLILPYPMTLHLFAEVFAGAAVLLWAAQYLHERLKNKHTKN
jgi:hypothetical protein